MHVGQKLPSCIENFDDDPYPIEFLETAKEILFWKCVGKNVTQDQCVTAKKCKKDIPPPTKSSEIDHQVEDIRLLLHEYLPSSIDFLNFSKAAHESSPSFLHCRTHRAVFRSLGQ